MIYNEIKAAYTRARQYVEHCCIQVNQEGASIQAFTEYAGKMRVTDWGGTSSALALLSQIGDSATREIAQKLNNASAWLISDQAPDGSWEAAEMQCCEATSAVIFDLYNTKWLKPEILPNAINYIQRCYQANIGAFTSQPQANQLPHLYTTYMAVRALHKYMPDSFSTEQKNAIIAWVNNSKASDDNWGMTGQAIEGTIAHTAFALEILYCCGKSVKELQKEYRKQIRWLKKQIKRSSTVNNSFSEEQIPVFTEQNADPYGTKTHSIRLHHFSTAVLCRFFILIQKWGIVQRLIKKLLHLEKAQNGWGLISENKFFVWATQQAIDCMYQFEKAIFKNGKTILSFFRSLMYTAPFFIIKLLVGLIIIPIIWKLFDANKGNDIVLSLVFIIIPWLIKRED